LLDFWPTDWISFLKSWQPKRDLMYTEFFVSCWIAEFLEIQDKVSAKEGTNCQIVVISYWHFRKQKQVKFSISLLVTVQYF